MANIISSSGVSYHLFGIQCAVKDSDSRLWFSELENDLGDSFSAEVLYGSAAGNRTWKLTFPTLPDSGTTLGGPTGEQLTKARYLWSLFSENKRTGKPFAYQDPLNEQYYLVKFADKELSFQRMLVKLFSSGVELKQKRIPGETIFDFNQVSPVPLWWKETGQNSPNWEEANNAAGFDMAATGDVVFGTGPQNGLNTITLNATLTTGRLNIPAPGGFGIPLTDIYEALLVCKINEATFSNNSGIITDNGSDGAAEALVGDSGTTKFKNLAISGLEYRLNGVEYAVTNMQAPMQAWGIVHLRFTAAMTVPRFFGFQMGKRINTASTQAKISIGELLIWGGNINSMDTIIEATEALQVKWGI